MDTVTTYSQAVQFLYDLQLHGLKLGLDNTRRLAALAGHPELRLRFLHVAGTNGKGSTCAMLESICRTAGWKVGLFSSPHLVHFGERIQVDRIPISEADIVRLVQEMQGYLQHFEAPGYPTFFEVVTVMAMIHFARAGCDLVIWETGMGGRLDATNIVTPLATVITNIQYDHEKWLGNTLAQIAHEKGGIIKPGVPVITAAEEPEALEVLRRLASENEAPLIEMRQSDSNEPPLDRIELPLLGDHQRLNAAVALRTLRTVARALPIQEEAFCEGLRLVRWTGRLQLMTHQNGGRTLLDGAHNPAGALTLRAALDKHFPNTLPALVIGVLRDKDWRKMFAALLPVAAKIFLVPVANTRSADPEELRAACFVDGAPCQVTVCHSLKEALDLSAQVPFRVVTGSLYLVGEALEMLETPRSAAKRHGERALNEWGVGQPR